MIPIDGIDVERGLRLSLSDEEFFAELLGIFLEAQERSRCGIAAALAEGRATDALRLVHSMRGEAANIGAEELRERAGAFELVLREGRESDIPAATRAFEDALARVSKSIQAFLSSKEASSLPASAP